jgi:hypothetical protein
LPTLIWEQDVGGSNPLAPTNYLQFDQNDLMAYILAGFLPPAANACAFSMRAHAKRPAGFVTLKAFMNF